jgi:hypothetical protein
MSTVNIGAAIATFSITLGDTHLSNAVDYDLNVEGKKKFSLRVKLRLLDEDDFSEAYQGGQKIDSAVIDVLDQSLNVVASYTLGDLQVETVKYTSSAATNEFYADIVLSAKSLVITLAP